MMKWLHELRLPLKQEVEIRLIFKRDPHLDEMNRLFL